ncbi:MAG TPA: CDP-alcohol phosphatidyltransferase family protein [Streptosporangiaceae bacterium]
MTETPPDQQVTAGSPGSAGQPAAPAGSQLPERVLTIPNLISIARLAGVPVFLWLVLGVRTASGDWWAVAILALAGFSDWLDGKIARALNQQSHLGELLDPAADRLYIVSTVVALAIRAIIGWWLVAVLAARELMLGVVLLALRRRGYGALHVSFVGKAATLNLLYAFPLLFLGSHHTSYAVVARVFGWAFALWGTALYWWAAALYVRQARRILAADRAAEHAG